MVFSGLVTAWRLATVPTSWSPLLAKPTTEGVVRPPSWLAITTGCPPSITATTELVVPKSIPMILLMLFRSSRLDLSLLLTFSLLLSTFQSAMFAAEKPPLAVAAASDLASLQEPLQQALPDLNLTFI